MSLRSKHMKKLIFATLILCSATLVSCEQPNPDGTFYGIEKIEYEGHTYLLFHTWKEHAKVDGITHDMNCKCLKDSL